MISNIRKTLLAKLTLDHSSSDHLERTVFCFRFRDDCETYVNALYNNVNLASVKFKLVFQPEFPHY